MPWRAEPRSWKLNQTVLLLRKKQSLGSSHTDCDITCCLSLYVLWLRLFRSAADSFRPSRRRVDVAALSSVLIDERSLREIWPMSDWCGSCAHILCAGRTSLRSAVKAAAPSKSERKSKPSGSNSAILSAHARACGLRMVGVQAAGEPLHLAPSHD